MCCESRPLPEARFDVNEVHLRLLLRGCCFDVTRAEYDNAYLRFERKAGGRTLFMSEALVQVMEAVKKDNRSIAESPFFRRGFARRSRA